MSEQQAKEAVGTQFAQHIPELAAAGALGFVTGSSGLEKALTRTGAARPLMTALKETAGVAEAGAESDGLFSQSAMKSVEANIRRGREAMNRAIVEKADVKRAMYRQDLGWVDFVWGSVCRIKPSGRTIGAMGISHILEARQRKDNMDYQHVVHMLTQRVPETVALGSVEARSESGNTVSLKVQHDGHQVSLVKQKGSNAWMVTAFELFEDAGRKGYDKSTPTDTDPTLSRVGTGASNSASDSEQSARSDGLPENNSGTAVDSGNQSIQTDSFDTQAHSRRGRGLGAENISNVPQSVIERKQDYRAVLDNALGRLSNRVELVSDVRQALPDSADRILSNK